MADIFTHFKSKLEANPTLTTLRPHTQSTRKRSETEVLAYNKWRLSAQQVTMMMWLRDQLASFQSVPKNPHDGIDFIKSNTSKSFRLHPALTRFPDAAYIHLFDYLKEQLLTLDYTLTTSDTRIINRPDYWEETIHRHVLKPINADYPVEGSQIDVHQFAQITIELLLKDNHLCILHLEAVVPNTDLPRPTGDFAALLERIWV